MATDDIDLDDAREGFKPDDETDDGNATRPKDVDDAIDEIKLVLEAEEDQRDLEEDDLAFDAGEHWPESVKLTRAAQVIDNVEIPARPMLTIPKLDQPVQLVINAQRKAHLGINVTAASEDADSDTADVIGDLVRHIQTRSNAALARNWAFERGAKAGRGYYRVLTQYCNHGGTGTHWSDQEILIKRILNQSSVYLDPYATEPDWSDGMFGQIGGFISAAEHKRRWPASEMTKLLNSGDDFELDQSLIEPSWMTNDLNGKGLRGTRVMERFKVEIKTRTRIAYRDEHDSNIEHEDYLEGDAKGRAEKIASLGERLRAKRETAERTVRWMKLNSVEILEEETWPGQLIPIIPVIGREQFYKNMRRWVGIIRPAKDGQRLFNYAATAAVEKEALDTKAPYIGYEGQFKGHESAWGQSATRNFPYLQVAHVSIGGQPAPFPERNVAGPNLSASLALLQAADNFIKATTFTYDPSLGDAKGQDSGRKVLALQSQADAGNSNYLDQLATVSLPYECKVLLDLIPHIYDRPGRVAQVMGTDEEEREVMLNAPFVKNKQTGRPQQVDPAMAQNPSVKPKGVKHYDLTKGAYNGVPNIGKDYKSRLQEGGDEIGRVLEAAPDLLKVIGDIYFKFRDFPGHQEIADRLKKMLPPQLQDHPDENDEPEALKAKLSQAMQSMDQLKKAYEEAMKAIETKQIEAQGKIQSESVKADSALKLEQFRLQGEERLAQIEADLKVKLAMIENHITMTEKQADIDAEAEAREDTQRHEVAMAQVEHGMDLEVQEAAHQQALISLGQQQDHTANEADAARRHEFASTAASSELGANEADAGRAHASDEAMADREHASTEAEAADTRAADMLPDDTAGGDGTA